MHNHSFLAKIYLQLVSCWSKSDSLEVGEREGTASNTKSFRSPRPSIVPWPISGQFHSRLQDCCGAGAELTALFTKPRASRLHGRSRVCLVLFLKILIADPIPETLHRFYPTPPTPPPATALGGLSGSRWLMLFDHVDGCSPPVVSVFCDLLYFLGVPNFWSLNFWIRKMTDYVISIKLSFCFSFQPLFRSWTLFAPKWTVSQWTVNHFCLVSGV